MPTYEYRCKDCGTNLEVVQSFADDPLTECPTCQGTLKKVFNSVGIAFKGSGFYRNDSRSGSGSSSSSGSSPSGSSSSSSSSDGGSSSGSSDGGSSSTSSSGSGDSGSSAKTGAATA